jgi:hypothetical protein
MGQSHRYRFSRSSTRTDAVNDRASGAGRRGCGAATLPHRSRRSSNGPRAGV